MSKKSKRNKKQASPAKVASKLVEVGEIRKSESLSPLAREKAAKAEKALAHEYAMANSPGYQRAQERREAEAARAA
jgi:hypothetical protein